MKNVIQLTTVLFLFIHAIGYSQAKNTETVSKKQDSILINIEIGPDMDTEKFKDFIGKYLLVEANFELEIIAENGKMYIISPFSKDLLVQKNETILREPKRGVELELANENENGLKFSQNGFETILKRMTSKKAK